MAFLQSISKAYTIERLALRLRSPAQPSPAKPRANIAQVDGSGTAEAEALPLKLALNEASRTRRSLACAAHVCPVANT